VFILLNKLRGTWKAKSLHAGSNHNNHHESHNLKIYR